MISSRKMIFSVLFFVEISSLLVGCTLMQLKEETKIAKTSIVLVGIVSSTLSSCEMPVVVAAYFKKGSKRTIVHYTMLHEPGPYELMVPVGTHHIIAFGDKNKNLIYDKGEPAGQILTAERVSASAGGVAGNLDIVLLEKNSSKMDFPVGFQIQPKAHKKFYSTCPGAIAKMDDVLFSDEYGKKGFWTGIEFFEEIGGNVYFLEAYDPAKIPILFVHGAAGSPQNWRAFFEGIDRDKYQPWIYYYPSGSSIDSMSHLLLWKMQNLQAKYKFNQLCIVAHSMGGLVVRSFLVNYGQSPEPDTQIDIQSITLRGGEVYRTLIPLQEGDSDSKHYLSATDFSSNGTFFFFGLPAGKYELTLVAKGYAPYSKIYTVIPGQYQNTIIIELDKKIVDPL